MRDRVKVVSREVLSENWGTLAKTAFDYQRASGEWQRQERETYESGDGAGVLLFDKARGTVVLTRQFRFPSYVNGEGGGLIEVCAGKLDGDPPEVCARREAEEESGYRVGAVTEAMAAVFMSPGSVTERLWLYFAEYDANSKVSSGGGLHEEGEDIEVIEMPFTTALAMVETGEIRDAKTVILLQQMRLKGIF